MWRLARTNRVGGLLFAFSFLIVPAIPVTDYLIEAFERTVAGRSGAAHTTGGVTAD